jgi:hypothetical protein
MHSLCWCACRLKTYAIAYLQELAGLRFGSLLHRTSTLTSGAPSKLTKPTALIVFPGRSGTPAPAAAATSSADAASATATTTAAATTAAANTIAVAGLHKPRDFSIIIIPWAGPAPTCIRMKMSPATAATIAIAAAAAAAAAAASSIASTQALSISITTIVAARAEPTPGIRRSSPLAARPVPLHRRAATSATAATFATAATTATATAATAAAAAAAASAATAAYSKSGVAPNLRKCWVHPSIRRRRPAQPSWRPASGITVAAATAAAAPGRAPLLRRWLSLYDGVEP